MSTVAIVYFSGTGHTGSMARAVAAGAADVANTKTELIAIEGRDIHAGRWRNQEILGRLKAADAIIFGSPTYMGSVAGQAQQEPPEVAPNEADRRTGEALGRRVAEITRKLSFEALGAR